MWRRRKREGNKIVPWERGCRNKSCKKTLLHTTGGFRRSDFELEASKREGRKRWEDGAEMVRTRRWSGMRLCVAGTSFEMVASRQESSASRFLSLFVPRCRFTRSRPWSQPHTILERCRDVVEADDPLGRNPKNSVQPTLPHKSQLATSGSERTLGRALVVFGSFPTGQRDRGHSDLQVLLSCPLAHDPDQKKPGDPDLLCTSQ